MVTRLNEGHDTMLITITVKVTQFVSSQHTIRVKVKVVKFPTDRCLAGTLICAYIIIKTQCTRRILLMNVLILSHCVTYFHLSVPSCGNFSCPRDALSLRHATVWTSRAADVPSHPSLVQYTLHIGTINIKLMSSHNRYTDPRYMFMSVTFDTWWQCSVPTIQPRRFFVFHRHARVDVIWLVNRVLFHTMTNLSLIQLGLLLQCSAPYHISTMSNKSMYN